MNSLILKRLCLGNVNHLNSVHVFVYLLVVCRLDSILYLCVYI